MRRNKWIIPSIFILALLIVGGYIFLHQKENVYTDPRDIPVSLKEIVYADEEDADGDGLTNGKERKLKTDIKTVDSDKDGIDDYSEVNGSKTNPVKSDTDGDGLSDGVELMMKLNPLEKKTDGKTLDSNRTFTKEYAVKDCTLSVEGDANISSIYVGTLDECNITNLPGVVSELYEFYMKNMHFDKATVTFTYDKDKLKKQGQTEEDLAVFQLLDDGTFNKVGGTVNAENNNISVELEHFSKYFVANESILNKEITSQVFILLDNSGSMYPKDMVEGSGENDVDFKRVDMAKELIQMSDKEEIHFGLAKFTATYTELLGGFNNSEEALTAALDSIKTTPETFNGTYIANSIKDALENFDATDNEHRKFILLLTDGETTEGGLWDWSFYDENNAIKDANDKNVSIIVVGLGNSVDTEYLTKIANGTGGAYIYANNDNALTDVYDVINAGLNYNMVDSDGDGEKDRILIADNGFDVEKDALSFQNPIVELYYNDNMIGNGLCYGMASFMQLYYAGKLPLVVEEVPRNDASPGLLVVDMIESKAADISEIEFFANEGSSYANSKKNLSDYDVHSLYSMIREADSGDIYERDKDNPKILVYKDEIREMIEASDILAIRRVSSSVDYYWSYDKKAYNGHEKVIFTLNVDSTALEREAMDAYNMMMCIHNYWAGQNLNERISRTYSFCSTALFVPDDQENNFNQLITDLKNGVLPVLNGPSHSINAMALYRDIENPSEYILKVYDSNSPGEEKELRIVKTLRNKYDISAENWTNDYDYEVIDCEDIFMQGENTAVSIEFEILAQ